MKKQTVKLDEQEMKETNGGTMVIGNPGDDSGNTGSGIDPTGGQGEKNPNTDWSFGKVDYSGNSDMSGK